MWRRTENEDDGDGRCVGFQEGLSQKRGERTEGEERERERERSGCLVEERENRSKNKR